MSTMRALNWLMLSNEKTVFRSSAADLLSNPPRPLKPSIDLFRSQGHSQTKCYLDQANSAMGELYCGCKWTLVAKSGGRIDAESCGYKPGNNRAA